MCPPRSYTERHDEQNRNSHHHVEICQLDLQFDVKAMETQPGTDSRHQPNTGAHYQYLTHATTKSKQEDNLIQCFFINSMK